MVGGEGSGKYATHFDEKHEKWREASRRHYWMKKKEREMAKCKECANHGTRELCTRVETELDRYGRPKSSADVMKIKGEIDELRNCDDFKLKEVTE